MHSGSGRRAGYSRGIARMLASTAACFGRPAKEAGLAREERFYPRVFGLVVAAVLGYALLLILRPFLGPILWALLLAFLLFPWYRKLCRKLKGRRGLAALLLTAGVTLGIVVPVAMLGTAFAGQAAALMDRVSEIATRYRIARPQDILRLPVLDGVVQWISDRIPVTAEQVQAWIVQGARQALAFVAASSRFVFLGALGVVVGLTLMLFVLYFFFRDGEEIARRAVRLIPLDAERKRRLVKHLSEVTRAVVFGSLLTALVQGTLVGIAFAVAGLPSPIVFGVLASAASLIPFVGTALVWLPGAVVLAAQGKWGWAIFLLVWGIVVVGLSDNLLRPLFISGRAEIAALPVFIGVIGGLAAFGTIGLFLGPLVIALVLALIRFAEEDAEMAEGARGAKEG